MTTVSDYWSGHTVKDEPFTSAKESLDYLQWRSDVYPRAYEMLGLYGEHKDEVILDFGCGPGNDLVGFLSETKAKQVIGIDVSPKALNLAKQRLDLHDFSRNRCRLILGTDGVEVPLETASVDHVNCQGVLHHISQPQNIVNEFYRVLRPGGTADLMVYNYDSLYLHLYVAYELQILRGITSDLDIKAAFSKNTDGYDCPIAYPYKPAEFVTICETAGFNTSYRGGYCSQLELDLLRDKGAQALADNRLGEEHKEFLRGLGYSASGYPLYDLVPAGVGGVYHLSK